MQRYISLLRGINISGRNKIKMSELKNEYEHLDFIAVKTYLNSGNVIFSSETDDKDKIVNQIEDMIKERFDLVIPVFIIPQESLKDIIHNAPKWWDNDNKEIYDNLIFIIPPLKFQDVYMTIGEPKKDLEQIQDYKDVIFWSYNRKDYKKTNWWAKTASTNISTKLTIRTANTIKKLIEM